MKNWANYLLIFLFLQSCGTKNNENELDKYIDYSMKTDSLNVPLDSNQAYFTFEKFTDPSIFIGYDTSLVTWYSRHLRAMNEPVLFNKRPKESIFRFLWLRSFHNPVAIRIEKIGDSYNLTWKFSDGRGGYNPGKLKTNKSKIITKEDWEKFQSLLEKADYWNLKTNDTSNQGTDGSQWILEGVDETRYHVVDRWTPREGDFYECCDFLIGLTDLEIIDDNKY